MTWRCPDCEDFETEWEPVKRLHLSGHDWVHGDN